MTNQQQKFLQLAVIDQMKYAEIEEEMGVGRKQLSKWWEELKTDREKLSKIRQIWKKKCSEIDFWDFHKWYTNTVRKCYYCNITEEQIRTLIDKGKIKTKRLSTRGKTLEIDRREPNKPYDEIANLVFCCYWCNNAKTDEFEEEEFKPIGMEIGKALRNRLKEQ